MDGAVSTLVASAFFFIATSCFWNPSLLPPTTEDKDRYVFSKLHTQELMIYRSHVTLAHTAHHDFFNFMSRESNSESRLFSFFFFLCLNLMLHEPTQRITIFLTSCQVSPHSATFFFLFWVNLLSRESTQRIAIFFNFMSRESNSESRLFFLLFVFTISCYMSPHSASRFFYLHVRWVHTAQHFFSFLCVNLISRESTQCITIFLTSCQMSPHSATFFFFFVRNSHITWVHTAHHDSSNLTLHELTNDRWGWSTPSTWCQTYNLSIRKPLQWIQMTIKGMFWTYKKQERKRNWPCDNLSNNKKKLRHMIKHGLEQTTKHRLIKHG